MHWVEIETEFGFVKGGGLTEDEAREDAKRKAQSLRTENHPDFLGWSRYGAVMRYPIPEGLEFGRELSDPCKTCAGVYIEEPRFATNVGNVTGCKNGHFRDVAGDAISTSEVARWLADDESAARDMEAGEAIAELLYGK